MRLTDANANVVVAPYQFSSVGIPPSGGGPDRELAGASSPLDALSSGLDDLLRTVDPDALIGELRRRVAGVERDNWLIGDLVVRLRSKVGWSYKRIAQAVPVWSPSRYHQIAQVTEQFPPALRDPAVAYAVYESAVRSNKPGPNREPKSPREIAAMIRAGARTPRQITEALEAQREQAFAAARQQEVEAQWADQLGGVVNRPHRAPWEQVIEQLPDAPIVDAVWADPMFGAYARDKTITSTGPASVMTGAANAEAQAARATTYALFDRLPRVLREGAVLYLHQHGGSIDDPDLIRYAESRGWTWHTPCIWHVAQPGGRGKASPDKLPLAYASSCQRILIATHGEGPPRVRGNKYNGNVVQFPAPSQAGAMAVARGAASRYDHHACEHPPDLAAELMQRVLPLGSGCVVLEPFGCSAPGSVAAVRCGWNWIYCEMHEPNYQLGVRRLSAALRAAESPSGVASGVPHPDAAAAA